MVLWCLKRKQGNWECSGPAGFLISMCRELLILKVERFEGPWIQQEEPITPPNYGHGMMFHTFDGKLLMSLHSHRVGKNGRYIRHPELFIVDDSGDKIKVLGPYTGSD